MNNRSVRALIEKLEKLDIDWFIDDLGEMVGYIDDTLYCPLTALYYTKTGNYLPRSKGVEAGKKLGYKADTAEYIRRLADNELAREYNSTDFFEHENMLKKLVKKRTTDL